MGFGLPLLIGFDCCLRINVDFRFFGSLKGLKCLLMKKNYWKLNRIWIGQVIFHNVPLSDIFIKELVKFNESTSYEFELDIMVAIKHFFMLLEILNVM